MSKTKYRPKLTIDTKNLSSLGIKEDDIYQETDKYSITPRTFESRNFLSKLDFSTLLEEEKKRQKKLDNKLKLIEKFNAEVNNLKKNDVISDGELTGLQKQPFLTLLTSKKNKIIYQQKLSKIFINDCNALQNVKDILFYEDTYSVNKNNVLRYGINLTKNLGEAIKKYNNNISQSREDFKILDDKSSVSSKNSRKSNKSNKSKKSSKNSDEHKELHPIEVLLLKKATDHLKKHKAVVVDIFAREDDDTIKYEDGLPENHAVVLYKNNDKEIVVIDPSNSDFSKHLASSENIEKIFDGNNDIKISVPSKRIKIYEGDKKNIGPKSDQGRDCIDIAAKIALKIQQISKEIDISNLDSLDIIQQVTNQREINENIFFGKEVVRIRQASDNIIGKTANEMMTKIHKQIKAMKQYGNLGELEILKNSIKQFKVNYMPEKYNIGIRNLYTTYTNNKSLIDNEMKKQKNELLEDLIKHNLITKNSENQQTELQGNLINNDVEE